jgi:hypothetical protein
MEGVSLAVLKSLLPDREEIREATEDELALLVFNYCNKLKFEISQLKKEKYLRREFKGTKK